MKNNKIVIDISKYLNECSIIIDMIRCEIQKVIDDTSIPENEKRMKVIERLNEIKKFYNHDKMTCKLFDILCDSIEKRLGE